MKKPLITLILAILASAGSIYAQGKPIEYLGLPGDNLNLYAVLNLFQESETIEGFERNLNDKDSRINNLDLNGDNFVDYIMVLDYKEGDIHTIVLQVALNETEKQDVAAFTVQRFRDGSVQIQLTGDPALYGENYIIEPISDEDLSETPNPGYTGKKNKKNKKKVKYYNATSYVTADWPLIIYIYEPDYSPWHSDWHWGYFPSYWNPWSPYYYHYYYGYHSNLFPEYYRHYRHWQYNRSSHYHDFYQNSIRIQSPMVSNRITNGSYMTTYTHPEQRSNGEALYDKTHSRRIGGSQINNRTSSSDNAASSTRRSGDATTTRTESSSRRSTGTDRRSTATEGSSTGNSRRTSRANRSSDTSPSVQTESTSRRQSSSGSNTGTNPSPVQTESNTRRSSSSGSNTVTNPSAVQSEGSSRRSSGVNNNTSEPQPNRSVSRPEPQPQRQSSQPERSASQPQRQYSQPERSAPQPERQVSQPAPVRNVETPSAPASTQRSEPVQSQPAKSEENKDESTPSGRAFNSNTVKPERR